MPISPRITSRPPPRNRVRAPRRSSSSTAPSHGTPGSVSLHCLRRFGLAWCQITPVPSAASAANQPISVLGPGGPPMSSDRIPMPTPRATNGTNCRTLRLGAIELSGNTAQNAV